MIIVSIENQKTSHATSIEISLQINNSTSLKHPKTTLNLTNTYNFHNSHSK